jgi:hypothetical protein
MSSRKICYHPTPADLDWAETVFRPLKDGGLFVYPSSGLVYQLNRGAGIITLVNPHPRMRRLHQWSVAVFEALGYMVLSGTIEG